MLAEFEEKRRRAETNAHNYKAEVYRKFPMLIEIEREISNTATDFTKRMISGENVAKEMSERLAELTAKKNEFLLECGVSPSDFEPKYECEVCKDKGFTDNGACACFEKRVIEENFKSSNIGDTLSHQTFDNFSLPFT